MATPQVQVVGTGVLEVETTIAMVRLGILKHDETAAAAQSAMASALSTLLAYLRDQKVSNLQTTGVRLNEYEHSGPPGSPPPPKSLRYTASNGVSFEVPVEQCGPILDGAVEAGATKINGVSFRATPEVNVAARENAIVDAVSNAKREANIAATTLGLKLGKALNVQIKDTFRHDPFQPEPRRKSGGNIIAEKSSVQARVSITFEIA